VSELGAVLNGGLTVTLTTSSIIMSVATIDGFAPNRSDGWKNPLRD